MNYSRVTFILLLVATASIAMVYFDARAKNKEFFDKSQNEWVRLAGQIESQSQFLGNLQSTIEELGINSRAFRTPSSTTSPSLELLNRRLSELAAQQSNILVLVQRQGRARSTESPEEATQRAEAAVKALQKQYAEHQQKLSAAREKLDSLRVSLSVPDEVAALDDRVSTYDPRVSQYRPYFEARQAFEQLGRLAQVLYFKMAAERIDAELPVSP